IEQLALLGEDEAARVTMEERNAEALLESADLPADRRLAEIQRLAGRGEAAGLGNRVEHPQFIPVHPRPLTAPVPKRQRPERPERTRSDSVPLTHRPSSAPPPPPP